jgi:hypothetical protein
MVHTEEREKELLAREGAERDKQEREKKEREQLRLLDEIKEAAEITRNAKKRLFELTANDDAAPTEKAAKKTDL